MQSELISTFCSTPSKVHTKDTELAERNANGFTHIDHFFLNCKSKSTVCEELVAYLSLYAWGDAVCIDGMTCVGKTSIMNHFPGKTAKINQYMNIQTYNVSACTSLAYFLLSLKLATESTGIVLDRSPISNFAWLLINQLANKFPEAPNREFTWTGEVDLVFNCIQDADLVLRLTKSKNVSAIIILDSDLDVWKERLVARNENRDSINAASDTFWYQLPVYAYLANKLNWPTVDLAYFRSKYPDEQNLIEQVISAITQVLTKHFTFYKAPSFANIVCHKTPITHDMYLNNATVAQSMSTK